MGHGIPSSNKLFMGKSMRMGTYFALFRIKVEDVKRENPTMLDKQMFPKITNIIT